MRDHIDFQHAFRLQVRSQDVLGSAVVPMEQISIFHRRCPSANRETGQGRNGDACLGLRLLVKMI